MIFAPLPHDIAIFTLLPRLWPPIFETLKTPNQVGESVKNIVFLQGAQKVDFKTFFANADRDPNLEILRNFLK